MTDFPRVTYIEKSRQEKINWLLEQYQNFVRLPYNRETIIFIERILRDLSNYVTLIIFEENGDYGVVDIDMSIENIKRDFEYYIECRQRRSYYEFKARFC